MKATKKLKLFGDWLINHASQYSDGTYCIVEGAQSTECKSFEEVVAYFNEQFNYQENQK